MAVVGTVISTHELTTLLDDAGIAQEAIAFGKDLNFDVVLVDTAGRMQNNTPLMRSLAKVARCHSHSANHAQLIRVNAPDLVLFVGEALVGNEAIDQLVKFNQVPTSSSGRVLGSPVVVGTRR